MVRLVELLVTLLRGALIGDEEDGECGRRNPSTRNRSLAFRLNWPTLHYQCDLDQEWQTFRRFRMRTCFRVSKRNRRCWRASRSLSGGWLAVPGQVFDRHDQTVRQASATRTRPCAALKQHFVVFVEETCMRRQKSSAIASVVCAAWLPGYLLPEIGNVEAKVVVSHGQLAVCSCQFAAGPNSGCRGHSGVRHRGRRGFTCYREALQRFAYLIDSARRVQLPPGNSRGEGSTVNDIPSCLPFDADD